MWRGQCLRPGCRGCGRSSAYGQAVEGVEGQCLRPGCRGCGGDSAYGQAVEGVEGAVLTARL